MYHNCIKFSYLCEELGLLSLTHFLSCACATPVISYGLCWDSIQHPQYSSHSQKRNPDPLMAQAYAARNRVPFLMTYKDQDIRLADNISFEEFVPDSEDFIRVREQMKKEVQKILIKYLKVFNKLTVTEHHHYSDLMMQKNYMVWIGHFSWFCCGV